MREAEQFGRLITAMETPFDRHEELDIDRVRRVSTHLVETGTQSIVIAGTTGESPTLTEQDRMRLLEVVSREVGDQVRVIAGTSTYSTAESIHLSKLAKAEGAHGLLLVTPYYNKPSQRGLLRHFRRIAEAVDLPLILYNVPSRTNVNMQPSTVITLDSEFPHIAGLKEAVGVRGNPQGRAQVIEVLQNVSEGFRVWSGNDQDTLDIMDIGGYGVISVGSHLIGASIRQMIELHVAGKRKEARAMEETLMPLFEHLFPPTSPEPSPSALKAMLEITGLDSGVLRSPMVEVPEEYRTILENLLAHYNLLPQGGEAR